VLQWTREPGSVLVSFVNGRRAVGGAHLRELRDGLQLQCEVAPAAAAEDGLVAVLALQLSSPPVWLGSLKGERLVGPELENELVFQLGSALRAHWVETSI
jgi:hypothetical protein